MNIKIRDSSVPSVAKMRELFESSCNNTPALKRNTNTDPLLNMGGFSGYKDTQTDAMWIGFSIGLRCAVRFVDAGKLEELLSE